MKAIQMSGFGEPDVLRMAEVALPEPGPGEVRVKLHYAGVNPAEAYIRSGAYAFFKPEMPYIPGFDGAGAVDKVGEGVRKVIVGERVFVASLLAKRKTGTYAEYVVCDAEAVHHLPAAVSFAQGASLGVPAITAHRAIFQRGALKPGETVLIHGASGGVGSLAVQMARASGAYVIGTTGKDEDFEFIKQLGAHTVYNHADPAHFEQILKLTGGKGVDVIMEALANVNLERDAEILAMFGRIVVVGNRGSIQFTPRLLMAKESSVLGMALWNTPPAEYAASIAAIGAFLESGVLRPFAGKEYALDQAAQAQTDVLGHGYRGKMVLKIG